MSLKAAKVDSKRVSRKLPNLTGAEDISATDGSGITLLGGIESLRECEAGGKEGLTVERETGRSGGGPEVADEAVAVVALFCRPSFKSPRR